MSDETTSQNNTEDVTTTDDQPMIGKPAEEQEAKGPARIYEETEEDKALRSSEQKDEEEPVSAEDEDKSKEDETEDDAEGDDEDSKESFESFKKPDDSELSDEDVQRILESAKEEGLGKEAAQKRVEEADSILKSFSERTMQTHQAMVNKWAVDAKADKEIGGDSYKESVELARRTAHKFGTKEFLESLNKTGFGNHPEVIRTFARIGRQMADDTLVTDGSQTLHQTRDLADVFYGNETQTQE